MTGGVLLFDSGIGGLSVAGAMRALRPDLALTYLADNAAFPYGDLADAVLIDRLERLLDAAVARWRPSVVVIACNTASTVALEAIRGRLDVPVVGCVPPIKWAADLSRSRTIGLLATPATVRRPYLRALRDRFAPDCVLIAHGAQGLAAVAETVFLGAPIDDARLRAALDGLFDQPGAAAIDAVGIGCTHYSFLLDRLRALSAPHIAWLDPAGAVARHALTVLDRERPAPAAGSGRNRAWFTAPVADPGRLAAGLARFGFDAPALFAAECAA